MKFFCEQCKAKYQIADDKVAGKTVRMKCRKCGHLIELRAEVTESSALGGAPASTGSSAPSSSPDASAKPTAPRPAARLPPRPNALATSLTATKPAPQKPERSGAGALAGAFKSNVQRDEEGSAPFDMADLAPGDDWYVAVNGVPVGPIRIAEVRRKAALGAVTEDSLVWQEGLDEWRPLKSFPDLAANVREAAAGGRISITPPPPDARHSAPPPRPPTMRPASSVSPSRVSSSRPMQGLSPSARSNVVPFTSRLATAEKLEDAPTEIGAVSTLTAAADPFALPPPAAAAPAALAPAAPAVASASVAPSYAPTEGRSRKQPPWGAIAMIAGTMAFGTVAGIAIFFKPSAPPQVVVQVPPTPTAPPAANAPAVNAAPGVTTEPVASAPAAPNVPNPGGGRTASAGTGSRTAEAAPTSTGRSLDLNGIHGSKIAPDDPGAEGAAPGQCISAGQVQQVLGLHQVAIRRSCWERNPTTRPTVNVSVAMTVGADGSAQNVSASGDDASVAKCIENDVRGWHFPAMGCAQKTGFSFKFVRQ